MFDNWLPLRHLRILRARDPGVDGLCELRARRRGRSARCAPGRSRSSRASPGPLPKQRFTVSFYLTAMLFILFDIEIVFLYPLAVILNGLAGSGSSSSCLPRDPAARLRLHLAEGSARMAVDKPLARLRAPVRARADGRARGRASSSRRSTNLEQKVGLTTLEKAVAWAQTKSMWPDTFGLACCAIEMMSIVSRALRHRALRDGGVPRLAAPGRPADRLRPRRRTRWPRRCARSTTRCSSRSG